MPELPASSSLAASPPAASPSASYTPIARLVERARPPSRIVEISPGFLCGIALMSGAAQERLCERIYVRPAVPAAAYTRDPKRPGVMLENREHPEYRAVMDPYYRAMERAVLVVEMMLGDERGLPMEEPDTPEGNARARARIDAIGAALWERLDAGTLRRLMGMREEMFQRGWGGCKGEGDRPDRPADIGGKERAALDAKSGADAQ